MLVFQHPGSRLSNLLVESFLDEMSRFGFVSVDAPFLCVEAKPTNAAIYELLGCAKGDDPAEVEWLHEQAGDEGKKSSSRSISGIASVRNISRSGLLIEPEGIDLTHFRRNPVALACHNQVVPATLFPGVIATVGKVAVVGQALTFKNMAFDDDKLADAWLQKIRKGFVRMVSVGVRPIKVEYVEEEKKVKGEKQVVRYLRFVESELVEISPCGIGANRGAFIDPGERTPQALREQLDSLREEVERLRSIVEETDDESDESYGDASWPDAAFIVEKGAPKKDGRTVHTYRHLPHHRSSVKNPTENGSVDLPHLRNALARVGQVKPHKEEKASYVARAKAHLNAHARVLLKSHREAVAELEIALDEGIDETLWETLQDATSGLRETVRSV